jgi:K+ transporter
MFLWYALAQAACSGIELPKLQACAEIPMQRPPSLTLLQVVSLIFWSLTLVCLFKYVAVVLHANDNGKLRGM